MTKDELIQTISKKVGLSKRDAGECLTVILEEITKALSKGEEVILIGFGKFGISKRKERMGINPKTKKKIKIPAMKIPKFKPGKILKEAVK
ncbi:HU family DNA-binding protein [Candidatus Parcubacteria bacterium]|nr:HU family DNA-binding protein [Candidatus Parcubacteria bacterium]